MNLLLANQIRKIWTKPGVVYSEVVDDVLQRTPEGIQALREELALYLKDTKHG